MAGLIFFLVMLYLVCLKNKKTYVFNMLWVKMKCEATRSKIFLLGKCQDSLF